MEKITKNKRIIAVAIALGVLVISLVGNVALKDKQIAKLQEKTGSGIFTDFFDNGISENIIQGTDIQNRIMVIPITGTIGVDSVGAYGDGYNHQLILDSIEQAKMDPTVQAVLLDIDTGGGAVYHSEQVYQALLDLKEETDMPIYTSMGSVCASGGYYIASASDRLYAVNETITGSIGVISQYLNFEELANKVGIRYETFKSGSMKDSGNPTRSMTEEEKAVQQSMIDEMYNRFLEVVSKGREGVLTLDEIKTLADGRIYTGRQALNNGLIDQVGYFEDVVADLSELIDVEDPVVFTNSTEPGFFNYFKLFGKGFGGMSELDLFLKLSDRPSTPELMYIHGGY